MPISYSSLNYLNKKFLFEVYLCELEKSQNPGKQDDHYLERFGLPKENAMTS